MSLNLVETIKMVKLMLVKKILWQEKHVRVNEVTLYIAVNKIH